MTGGWCHSFMELVRELRHREECVILHLKEQGSLFTSAQRLSAIIWEQVLQAAGAHQLSAFRVERGWQVYGARGGWQSIGRLTSARRGRPSLPERGAWVRDGYCIPAVSIFWGTKMACGWCPPAVGIRSVARKTIGCFPLMLVLVRASCSQRLQAARAYRLLALVIEGGRHVVWAPGAWHLFISLASSQRRSHK